MLTNARKNVILCPGVSACCIRSRRTASSRERSSDVAEARPPAPAKGIPSGVGKGHAYGAGQVDASFQNINAIVSQVKGGKLRALAVTSNARSPLMPEVPTLAEAGVKNVDVYSWQAVAAPKGLPPDVSAKLHAALVKALADPALRAKLIEQGFEIVANTPAEFAKFQADEYARWKKVITDGNITQ